MCLLRGKPKILLPAYRGVHLHVRQMTMADTAAPVSWRRESDHRFGQELLVSSNGYCSCCSGQNLNRECTEKGEGETLVGYVRLVE